MQGLEFLSAIPHRIKKKHFFLIKKKYYGHIYKYTFYKLTGAFMACNIIGSMASLLAEVEAGELLFDGEAVTLREAAEDPPLFFD